MKAFQIICRQLRSSKGFSVEPALRVGFFTSSYSCGRKKKMNPYEEVNQEKYSNLVQSVLSFRGHAQTPESLFEEDTLLYGPVSKCKPPKQDEEAGVPGNWFPLFNPEKCLKPNATSDATIPLKIPLQKNKITSVTRVLQQTMTSEQLFYLERWKQRMILELGEDGFAEYTSKIFLQGKRFHEDLESILSPQENLKERDENLESGYIKSVQHILKDVNGVRALESAVQHKTLKYGGLLDCVAEYQGKLCVIDWKTSEKPKPFIQNTFDNPLQVVAYMGAINQDANYSFQVQYGLIVVAYKDGSPAHSHFMDTELCSQYWTKWLLRLEEYTKKEKNQNIQKSD
ncbi:mitochondrial genome maintenance exonuclease 1 [Pteropus alecto]|uniref:mitochondrial genome maintenance exonuclease 1 n=1 Tax=Pteropus alecto TaxID=9402 RepID=UPI0003F10DD9|nr:mitochondrial genome maintenance exonuclease 1 [Pteropus alecto]XP_015452515.1 mitochondrial genome maintenance exonuclease 1 [Pteropus alecto]XP_015452516.1 mitochondrial genome maintenance exonuclease 1 [Pteropus alecto]XP_015452517.1 mitochondrial genome maintenance exonuclease 1 [Pteropus alecto]XP_015452518.1 mitochondrial genome maintenance exonuclease 1 [Pteropus alecto]XP_024895457.1 mitochondrial genome maintenance exonuclease 1 [Pteropus alecto]XP_039730365.1 mitochondrial genome